MEYTRKAFSIAEELSRNPAATAADRMTFATYYMDYGYKQVVLGADRNAGLENLKKGSAMLEQIVALQPQDLKARRMLGLSYSRLAGTLADDPARQNEALDLYKKAIAIKQALVQADPTNAEFQRLVAYDKFARAELLAKMKQPDAALAGHREALAECQKLAVADPANAQLRQDLGPVREEIGEILAGLRRNSDALQQFKTSLAVLAKLPGADDPHTLNGGTVLMDQLWLGKVHTTIAASGDLSEKKLRHSAGKRSPGSRNVSPAGRSFATTLPLNTAGLSGSRRSKRRPPGASRSRNPSTRLGRIKAALSDRHTVARMLMTTR